MSQIETLRGAGALFGTLGRLFLELATAEECNDPVEIARLSNETVKLLVLTMQWSVSQHGTAPQPTLERAWQMLGVSSGWVKPLPEERACGDAPVCLTTDQIETLKLAATPLTPERVAEALGEPPLDGPMRFHPLVEEVLGSVRDLTLPPPPDKAVLAQFEEAARAYAEKACSWCGNVVTCADPNCAADTHHHELCDEERREAADKFNAFKADPTLDPEPTT
jgi:hypothetical protein